MDTPPPSDNEASEAARHLNALREALQKVLFGQDDLIDLVVTGMLANGHLLLEGLPGLGKTELVKGLAIALGLHHRRVQFTPDLLPGDITGTPLLEHIDGRPSYRFQEGPVFTQFLLADEINRASPKTQSALARSAAGTARDRPRRNPCPLPTPSLCLQRRTRSSSRAPTLCPRPNSTDSCSSWRCCARMRPRLRRSSCDAMPASPPEIDQVFPTRDPRPNLLALTRRIHLPDVVANFIARLVDSTHPGAAKASSEHVRYGASPRAALSLASACERGRC